MTIIGILAVLGIGGFRSAQIKSRDSRRKNDLVAISKALEIYYNDKGQYPDAISQGVDPDFGAIDGAVWGGSFTDPLEISTIYMAEFPIESISSNDYYYWSDNISFQLYARLENLNDNIISYDGPTETDVADGYSGTLCGTSLLCNFGVSSQNLSPVSNRTLIDDL